MKKIYSITQQVFYSLVQLIWQEPLNLECLLICKIRQLTHMMSFVVINTYILGYSLGLNYKAKPGLQFCYCNWVPKTG